MRLVTVIDITLVKLSFARGHNTAQTGTSDFLRDSRDFNKCA